MATLNKSQNLHQTAPIAKASFLALLSTLLCALSVAKQVFPPSHIEGFGTPVDAHALIEEIFTNKGSYVSIKMFLSGGIDFDANSSV